MKVVKNNNVMFFDVDNTLINHCHSMTVMEMLIQIVSVHGKQVPGTEFEVFFTRNTDHIKLLQRSKAKGMYIVVWSHGGYAWAEEIIRYLGLTEYVDLIIHKVRDYCDDCPIEEWQFVNHFLHDGYGNTARKNPMKFEDKQLK